MLSLYIGKPGSGKSYYAVLKIVSLLTDWVQYDFREGKPFGRLLYTNLQLNVSEISKYVSNKVGRVIDVTDYIVFMNDDFFFCKDEQGKYSKKDRIEWWENLPTGSFCIIDEVHHYLGAESIKEDKDFLESFRNYVSTHRHRQHDLIFITQHTDSIQKSILAMAADAYHIINVKNKVIPFLNIPFSDLDVVKESFGIQHQYIQILYGNYLSKSFKKETVFFELLKPEIYVLYKSHTKIDESSQAVDRPSLNLSPIGAIFWFVRRHFFNIGLKFLLIFVILYIIYSLIIGIPKIVESAFSSGLKTDKKKNNVTDVSDFNSPVAIPLDSVTGLPLQSPALLSVKDNNDDVIFGFLRNAVITGKGIFFVGEKIRVEGIEKIIDSVDFRNGKVFYKEVSDVTNNENSVVPVNPFDSDVRLQDVEKSIEVEPSAVGKSEFPKE
jgi:zona occludens toxin (predicted ATPase)